MFVLIYNHFISCTNSWHHISSCYLPMRLEDQNRMSIDFNTNTGKKEDVSTRLRAQYVSVNSGPHKICMRVYHNYNTNTHLLSFMDNFHFRFNFSVSVNSLSTVVQSNWKKKRWIMQCTFMERFEQHRPLSHSQLTTFKVL